MIRYRLIAGALIVFLLGVLGGILLYSWLSQDMSGEAFGPSSGSRGSSTGSLVGSYSSGDIKGYTGPAMGGACKAPKAVVDAIIKYINNPANGYVISKETVSDCQSIDKLLDVSAHIYERRPNASEKATYNYMVRLESVYNKEVITKNKNNCKTTTSTTEEAGRQWLGLTLVNGRYVLTSFGINQNPGRYDEPGLPNGGEDEGPITSEHQRDYKLICGATKVFQWGEDKTKEPFCRAVCSESVSSTDPESQ